MRSRRTLIAGAAIGVTALALTACAPPADDGNGAETEPTGSASISVSVGPNDFISYNGFTPETYSTYNSSIVDQLKTGFTFFGPDGTVEANTDLGSYELISEDPLTVEYTIAEDAAWSDGTPITVADAVLAWGVQNTNLAGADGPLFNSVSADLGDEVPEGPQGDADGKQFTVEFAVKNPDWQIQTWMLDPAHVVAEQSGLSTEELVEAILGGDSEALAPVAEFWNTGWFTNPGELPDEALMPSSGPYKLSSWDAGQSVTLVANEEYYGEQLAPQNAELVFRFVGQDAMVQALDNGDLDVIAPQPTVDTLAQLEQLGDAANILTGSTLTWEHLDFNFIEGSLFADNLELRRAFAMCVPREQIVENLIRPINSEAVVMNAREVFPFQDTYQEVLDASYTGEYDEPNIEEAASIVAAQGATGAEVRIGYSAPNPRRADEVALIKSSCDQAGFNIVDAGSEDFFAPGGTQERGDYEVALFAWAGSGQIASGENIYATDKPQNYGGYSNAEVDAAWATLKDSLDPAVHLEQTKVIEELLWNDLFGLPIFAHPGVDAASSSVDGVERTTTQSGISWNAYAWASAE
ncbi:MULTISPECIES: ABC transporter substrate-binding protein [unclassified Microbacterium]|uniref:ABC transporter substrate-binding protein n=1 Tax=unclassified Microbacterium TaxID=2609290 RepID=UPI00214BD37E|nr:MULTISPECIES: ABC transporter substrate-binding protein [unclassified Microbacterium]MCR2784442.1 ABC transporter substrate-binding protein [Microbacterium sp. zg.B96]MDL5350649.1 ABC transporter substrate-binding protein [Microbacterium sp. zg-YB36]WIM14745.1 ABC transporter substrate-binding protein [Microbacterium sp. zg-B96]